MVATEREYYLDVDVELPGNKKHDGETDEEVAERLKRTAKQLFERCECVAVDEEGENLIVAASAQAHYEDAVAKVSGRIKTRPFRSMRLAAEHLSRMWCSQIQIGLEEQPYLYISNPEAYCQDATPLHQNVLLRDVKFGSLVNSGLFRYYHEITYGRGGSSVKFSKTNVSDFFLDLLHDRNRMCIKFETKQRTWYKLELDYSAIVSMLAVPSSSDQPETIYLFLRQAPVVFEAVPPLANEKTGEVREATLKINDDWRRVLEFGDCPKSVIVGSPVIALNINTYETSRQASRDTDRAYVYNFRNRPKFIGSPFFHLLGRLRSKVRVPLAFASVQPTGMPRSVLYETQLFQKVQNGTIKLASYRATFSLEALLRRGFGVTSQFDGDDGEAFHSFLQLVSIACQRNIEAAEVALERLLDAVDERRNITLLYAFYKIFWDLATRQSNNEKLEADIPGNCLRVRKIVVTPSRLILLPPEILMGNRVLRKFGEEAALRVGFFDDNGWQLGTTMGQGWIRKLADVKLRKEQERAEPSHAHIEAHRYAREISEATVEHPLLNGLYVAGKHYKFLGWSNSQMRDHGCYMYMDTTDDEGNKVTVDDIRNWTGDWSKPMSVAKQMARMGQCFTQAQDTIPLTANQYVKEKDVKSTQRSDNDGSFYIFSDGVGRISKEAAREICKAHNPEIYPVPAAFQVRYGGYKGMLTVCDNLNVMGKKKTKITPETRVVFRDSMHKFDTASSAFLEVVKYSMPSPVYLNRPLVNILDQVSEKQEREDPESQVHTKLCNRIKELVEAELFAVTDMLCEEAECARALEDRTNSRIQFTLFSKRLLTITFEPFFRSMLLALHRATIVTQMHKLKVRVPMEAGRTMFGILDETGTLKYGQVFVKYSVGNPSDMNRRVLTGQIMVTKNPCLVSGDVRILEAVDVEALADCVDVIVFPRYGERPHTDEMAGSDLDGDEYSVYWDERLRFNHNEDALVRKTLEDTRLSNIQASQMVGFFVKHMHMDSIGRISNAHLANSDRYGLEDERCNEIALKHSCQVDFPKTGKAPPPLMSGEKPHMFPDYMEKDHKPMYRSHRLVGQLYRHIKRLEVGLDAGQQTITSEINTVFLRDGRETYMEKAADSMQKYNAQLQALIDQYGVEDEGALVSGHMTTMRRRVSNREKEDFSYYNTDKLIEMRYNSMHKHFRAEFFEEFDGEEEYLLHDEATGRNLHRVDDRLVPLRMLDKASAWYAVTYGPTNRTPYRSFAWIVWDLLLEVYTLTHPQTFEFDPLHERLGDLINKMCTDKERKLQSFLTFFQMIRRVPEIKQYCNKYKGLGQICYGLYVWTDAENLLLESRIEIKHVCLLMIQFATGQFDKEVHIEELNLGENGKASEGEMSVGRKGKLLLKFVRFLASRLFRTQEEISFNSLGEKFQTSEWDTISDVALTTYHTVAVTGKFSALHLTQEHLGASLAHDFGELIPPVAIYLTAEDKHHEEMARVLKEDSGAKDVKIRRPDSFEKSLLLVSATGTAQARQKIRDLLLVKEIPNEFAQNTMLALYFTSKLNYDVLFKPRIDEYKSKQR